MHGQTPVRLGNVGLENPPRGVAKGGPKTEYVVSKMVNRIEVIVHIIPTNVRVW
jgi:hypothetical protein